jgi:hypothetical protein
MIGPASRSVFVSREQVPGTWWRLTGIATLGPLLPPLRLLSAAGITESLRVFCL